MISKFVPTHASKAPVVRVCDYCTQNVCESNTLWGKHHDSFKRLQESADAFCVFCSSLLRAIKELYDHPCELKLPVYRWNIRRLTRVRETRDIVSVIFRPLDIDQDDEKVGEKGGALPEKIFHFYHEEDVGKLPSGAELGPSTDSTQSWVQVDKWIDECRTTHRRCRRHSRSENPLPTRLLDISEIDPEDWSVGRMRLVETKNAQIKEPYVTVSHKWGTTHKFIESTKENRQKMMNEGFPMNDEGLTVNFREAISVARRLQKRYIWIDSICILQGDPVDFSNEAPLMHQYYRYSFCNIAAADANEPSEGLFRDRNPEDDQFPISLARYVPSITNKMMGRSTWVVIPLDLWEEQLLQNPLYSRGWVFQERMLAPRILHYSRNQIFFECATISACETLPAGIPRASAIRAATDRHWRERLQYGISASERPLSGTADLSIEDFWGTAVNTYSRCNLTRGTDKVVAISGVARLVEDALGQAYRAGLWNDHLEEQLAWRVIECRKEDGSDSSKPRDRNFPSWSWPSVDGVVEVQDRYAAGDRLYHVTDHNDQPIRFELDTKKEVIDTPDALKKGIVKVEGAVAVPVHKHTSTTPEKNLTIKIRGYLQQGRLVWDTETRKGIMSPLSADHVKCDVFLDTPPHQNERECTFMVLAYSSNDKSIVRSLKRKQHRDVNQNGRRGSETVATFSGIGLLLREDYYNYFYRYGAFTFHSLSKEDLAALTTIKVLPNTLPGTETVGGDAKQPRDFFLF